MEHVFVYGLLMQECNAELSGFLKKNANFIDKGYTHGVLFDIGEYPGAIFQEGNESLIYGEIYSIISKKDEILAVLDEYEGCSSKYNQPYEYSRIGVNIIKISTSEILQCFAYQYNWPLDEKPVIQSGNYFEYVRQRI